MYLSGLKWLGVGLGELGHSGLATVVEAIPLDPPRRGHKIFLRARLSPVYFFTGQYFRFFLLIPVLFCLLAPSAFAENCNHDPRAFRCVKYVKNYDGDTITVDIPGVHPLLGKNISVRVRHIDTPEVKGRGPCEKEAARAARGLAENLLKNATRIHLENINRDKYFRILADVKVDGRGLKELLLKNQLAYHYEGGKKKKVDWCRFKVPSTKR